MQKLTLYEYLPSSINNLFNKHLSMTETFCTLLGDMILIIYITIKVIDISKDAYLLYFTNLSPIPYILMNKLEKLREHKLKISQYDLLLKRIMKRDRVKIG